MTQRQRKIQIKYAGPFIYRSIPFLFKMLNQRFRFNTQLRKYREKQ